MHLLVQDCAGDSLRYEFAVHGDWIEQHRPSDDRTFGARQLIRVLYKTAAMPIGQAILQFSHPALPREQCAVVNAHDSPVKDKRKIVLTLKPTATYAQKIERRHEARAWCGEYGSDLMNTWFEYHPDESLTCFLFVVYGWDEPLFDEQNILIGDTQP